MRGAMRDVSTPVLAAEVLSDADLEAVCGGKAALPLLPILLPIILPKSGAVRGATSGSCAGGVCK